MRVMATTRLFRNGHSQAVRIRPAGRPISGALAALARFSPDFLAEGRDDQQQLEREQL